MLNMPLRQVPTDRCHTHFLETMRTSLKRSAQQFDCPVEATLKVIGGKWKVVILWWLGQDIHRFGELKRKIPGITVKMLTQQLRELETDGIVHRKVYPEVPPKVEYSLTDYGRSLEPITGLMCDWGKKHLKRMERSSG
jgi:DNA-binding HxlR family transcriptional regulator